MKTNIIVACLVLTGFYSFGQENRYPSDLPQIIEKETPEAEIARLKDRREKLAYRLSLLTHEPAENATDIALIQERMNYIDRKIESKQKVISSIKYAEENGLIKKEGMSAKDFEQIKLRHTQHSSTDKSQIKTTLTRYELEKLPKERQEKILSMPERYTILD